MTQPDEAEDYDDNPYTSKVTPTYKCVELEYVNRKRTNQSSNVSESCASCCLQVIQSVVGQPNQQEDRTYQPHESWGDKDALWGLDNSKPSHCDMSSYNAVQKEQKTPLAELSWSDTDETILKSLDLYDDFKFWEHFFENDILTYSAITGDYGVACSDGERSVGEVVRSFDFSMDPFPHIRLFLLKHKPFLHKLIMSLV